ncbi:hypothetical protein [Cytobacillus firmus]|uniref:hypothetical protein n=1 Tax=Cytobacillus firmus TaxID=1399 RepID=UPI001362C68B|nr:hypothetical protein [Cytobacillus firmus]
MNITNRNGKSANSDAYFANRLGDPANSMAHLANSNGNSANRAIRTAFAAEFNRKYHF